MAVEESRLRQDLLEIFHHALQAVDSLQLIKRSLRLEGTRLLLGGEGDLDVGHFERVYVVGAGKAGAKMALGLEEILPGRIDQGFINVKYGHALPLEIVRLNEAGHPIPDENGVQGVNEMVQILDSASEKDIVFCLLSGGGSALLPLPAVGLNLDHKKEATRILLECGADIEEVNTVRKHLSAIKGGHLARRAHPATLVSLILSDVIGDRLDSIASGPAAPDPTTFADCLSVMKRCGIKPKLPRPVVSHLEKGAQGELPETPKVGDPAFGRTTNLIVGNNHLAVQTAAERAKTLGYQVLTLSTQMEGEAREVAKMYADIAKKIRGRGEPIHPPACVLSGGETTVTLRGGGKGGRNQELVLAAALEMAGLEGVALLSGGTDGTDGPTDAAGALADGKTVQRSAGAGLDARAHLQNNDAYPFFERLSDLLITGPTLTNVMDLHILLVG